MDKTTITKKFYETVTSKCNEMGLSIREFCMRTGWNESSFSAMKTQNKSPNFVHVINAFNLLSVDINQFIASTPPLPHQYVLTDEEEKLILLLRSEKRQDRIDDTIFLLKVLVSKMTPSLVSINSALLLSNSSYTEDGMSQEQNLVSASIKEKQEEKGIESTEVSSPDSAARQSFELCCMNQENSVKSSEKTLEEDFSAVTEEAEINKCAESFPSQKKMKEEGANATTETVASTQCITPTERTETIREKEDLDGISSEFANKEEKHTGGNLGITLDEVSGDSAENGESKSDENRRDCSGDSTVSIECESNEPYAPKYDEKGNAYWF